MEAKGHPQGYLTASCIINKNLKTLHYSLLEEYHVHFGAPMPWNAPVSLLLTSDTNNYKWTLHISYYTYPLSIFRWTYSSLPLLKCRLIGREPSFLQQYEMQKKCLLNVSRMNSHILCNHWKRTVDPFKLLPRVFKMALSCLRKIWGNVVCHNPGNAPLQHWRAHQRHLESRYTVPTYHVLCRVNLFMLMKNLKFWLRFWNPKPFIKPNKYHQSSFVILSCP